MDFDFPVNINSLVKLFANGTQQEKNLHAALQKGLKLAKTGVFYGPAEDKVEFHKRKVIAGTLKIPDGTKLTCVSHWRSAEGDYKGFYEYTLGEDANPPKETWSITYKPTDGQWGKPVNFEGATATFIPNKGWNISNPFGGIAGQLDVNYKDELANERTMRFVTEILSIKI